MLLAQQISIIILLICAILLLASNILLGYYIKQLLKVVTANREAHIAFIKDSGDLVSEQLSMIKELLAYLKK